MQDDTQNFIGNAIEIYNEFPEEMIFLVDFIRATAKAINKNEVFNKSKAIEEKRAIQYKVFLGHAKEILERIMLHETAIKSDAQYFASMLFGDGNRVFTLHCLFSLPDVLPAHDALNNAILAIFSK